MRDAVLFCVDYYRWIKVSAAAMLRAHGSGWQVHRERESRKGDIGLCLFSLLHVDINVQEADKRLDLALWVQAFDRYNCM